MCTGVRTWKAYGLWEISRRGMPWRTVRSSRASPSPKPSRDLILNLSPTKPCRKSCFPSPRRQASGLRSAKRKHVMPLVDPQETAYPMLSNSRMLMSGEGGSMTIVSGAMAGAPDVPLVLGVHIVSPGRQRSDRGSRTIGRQPGARSPPRRGSFTRIPPSVNRSARRCLRRMAGLCIPDNPRNQGKTAETVRYGMVPINYRSSVSNRITK